MNHKDLRVGCTYNREYVGENKAYAKINGKETFIVTSLNPLKVRILYCKFGSLRTFELMGNEITFSNPDVAFKDFVIYIPKSESDFFKKAQIMRLQEAFRKGLIDVAFLKQVFVDQSRDFISRCPITSWTSKEGGFFTFSSRSIEGKCPNNPYLQAVYFKYDSMKELKMDVRSLYPDAWFM